MITLRRRLIKLSPKDKDLFHHLLHDTCEQSLKFEWFNFRKRIAIASTEKPWAGEVSADKTRFKIVGINDEDDGKARAMVMIEGEMIVIDNEPWLKLAYKLFWAAPISIAICAAFLIFSATTSMDATIEVFLPILVILPLISLYLDLRKADKRILKYIRGSET
ncbi:MAG TPA: hypothetical protein VIU12_04490 [Chryseolinea sp.]